MKGYKGMNMDMTCRGMQFEVGKSYHVDGDIAVCYNGLHFCEKLKDVFVYYTRNGHRFFEVEASGKIKTDGNKSATSDLLILKELTDIEINRISYGNGYGDGDVYGNGYGNGDGYGYGNGYGNGNGYVNGYGYGDGYVDIQRILLFV